MQNKNVRLIPKPLWKEEYTYYSEKPIDELRADISELLKKTEGWDFSVNLTGEFISEYKFEMIPKWQFAIIKNFERDISYLKGGLYSDEPHYTRVTFTVRPNSIFLIFFFLSPIIGIATIPLDFSPEDIQETLTLCFMLLILIPVLMLVFGYFAKRKIKNTFTRCFGLKSQFP